MLTRRDQRIQIFDRLLLSCFVLVLQANASQISKSGAPHDEANRALSPSRTEVSTAITLASDYLVHSCGPDGKFTYQVDINSGEKSRSYDIIRHAGAIYSLAMLNHSQPDPQAVAAIIRAAKFLRENYIRSGAGTGQLAVWSQPLPGPSGDNRAKERESYSELGGVGLGLVALAAARQVQPESVSLEDLQALGRFALFLQRADGSFVHKYRTGAGPVPKWTSLYYPGEAALGFIALYETDNSREWLTAAGKALSYLARSRTGLITLPADHWALIATAKLLPYCERGSCPGSSREELVDHAIAICNSILREQFRSSGAVGLDGAFDPTGGTARAATRMEGLLAALEFLPKNELRTKIEAASKCGIAFLLRMQINSGPYAGGLPGAFAIRSLDLSRIRIDYVQHALCAWLRYRTLLDNSGMAE